MIKIKKSQSVYWLAFLYIEKNRKNNKIRGNNMPELSGYGIIIKCRISI